MANVPKCQDVYDDVTYVYDDEAKCQDVAKCQDEAKCQDAPKWQMCQSVKMWQSVKMCQSVKSDLLCLYSISPLFVFNFAPPPSKKKNLAVECDKKAFDPSVTALR